MVKGSKGQKFRCARLLSCQDPRPVQDWPLTAPSTLTPTILWDPQHYATIPPNPNWPPRPPTLYCCPLRSPITFQSSILCFSPLALYSHFHVPISVSIFPFLIYCCKKALCCWCRHKTVRGLPVLLLFPILFISLSPFLFYYSLHHCLLYCSQ